MLLFCFSSVDEGLGVKVNIASSAQGLLEESMNFLCGRDGQG
jgi:hypothetical protein